MPFSSHTDHLNNDDRRRIAAILSGRIRRSPIVPALVALAGVVAIVAAFFVWHSSLEGAATLLLVGATMLALGAFIAHGRHQLRSWARPLDEAFKAAIDQNLVQVHVIESAEAIPVPEFDEDCSAALFKVETGYILVREDVLSFLPGWDNNVFPRSLTVRLLATHTVLGASRGESDCAVQSELSEHQRTTLFDYLDAHPDHAGPICFIPANILPS